MNDELLSALISRAKKYLYDNQYTESTVERSYGYIWNRLLSDVGDITDIDLVKIKQHCINYYKKDLFDLIISDLNFNEIHIKNKLNALLKFKNDNMIQGKSILSQKKIIDDYTMHIINEYLIYQKTLNISKNTIDRKKECLLLFFSMFKLEELNKTQLIDYFDSLKNNSKYATRLKINKLKNFLKYCALNNYIDDDFECVFPKHTVSSKSSISSTYTDEEIKQVIDYNVKSQGVNSKRNYVIILLIALYGIRAKDISMLQISNVDLENNFLHFKTSKTGVSLKYKLFPIVSNAFIDYILNERPKIKSKFIFILNKTNVPITSNIVTIVVGRAFKDSNIDITNKHFGAHSLRSSLATRMMENNIPIKTISSVLGHASIDTTKIYLKVDIKHLKLCHLEVIDFVS